MSDCEVSGCKKPSSFRFYGRYVCLDHWLRDCDPNDSFNLKAHFSIEMNEYEIEAWERSKLRERTSGKVTLNQFSTVPGIRREGVATLRS